MTQLAPYSYEEVDTQVVLHAADAAKRGFQKVLIRTVDSDVVALCMQFK